MLLSQEQTEQWRENRELKDCLSKTNRQGKKHFFSRKSKKTGSLYEETYNWMPPITKKIKPFTKTTFLNIQSKTIKLTEENTIFMNVK